MNVLLAQPSRMHILALEPTLSLYNKNNPPEDTHSDTYSHRHNTPYLLVVAISLVSCQFMNTPSALKEKQSGWWRQKLPPWSYFHSHKLVVLRVTRFQSTVLCHGLLPAASINCWRCPAYRRIWYPTLIIPGSPGTSWSHQEHCYPGSQIFSELQRNWQEYSPSDSWQFMPLKPIYWLP